MSGGLFAPLDRCWYQLGAVIIVLHSFLAQYFKPSIVYICSFPVELPLWLSENLHKANNDVFPFQWHHLSVLFPPLGMLVPVLDGCTVGTIGVLLGLLWNVQGLSCKCRVRCQIDGQHCKPSTPRVLHVIWMLFIYEVPGGCARWKLGRFVFVKQQNEFNQVITETCIYISLLPAYTSILFSCCISQTASILNYPNIMWLAQNNASCSKPHPLTYSTL